MVKYDTVRIYRITPTGFALMVSFNAPAPDERIYKEHILQYYLDDAAKGTRYVVVYPEGSTDIYTVQTTKVLV